MPLISLRMVEALSPNAPCSLKIKSTNHPSPTFIVTIESIGRILAVSKCHPEFATVSIPGTSPRAQRNRENVNIMRRFRVSHFCIVDILRYFHTVVCFVGLVPFPPLGAESSSRNTHPPYEILSGLGIHRRRINTDNFYSRIDPKTSHPSDEGGGASGDFQFSATHSDIDQFRDSKPPLSGSRYATIS